MNQNRLAPLPGRTMSSGEENIAVYGGYANKLIKLQNDLLQILDRRRRGGSQSIEVKHVHFHPGAQGVVGIVNQDEGQNRGGKGQNRGGSQN